MKRCLSGLLVLVSAALVSADPGATLHPNCQHPSHPGNCAAYCPNGQECKRCCNRGWPRTADFPQYLECRTRCNDVYGADAPDVIEVNPQ